MLPLANRLNLTEEGEIADGTSLKVVLRSWGILSYPMEDSPIEYNERQAPVSVKVASNLASVELHECYVRPDPEEDNNDGDGDAKRSEGATRGGEEIRGELELLPGVKLKDIWNDPSQGVGGRRAGSSLDPTSSVPHNPFQTILENPGKYVFDQSFLARNPQFGTTMEAIEEHKAPARQATTARHESEVSEISKTVKTATAKKAVKHHDSDDGDDGSSSSSFSDTDSDDDRKPARVLNKKRAPITIESLGKDYTGTVLKSDLDLEDDGSIVTTSTARAETGFLSEN
jgi:hypothetical protein